jgi:hypothetical protein
METVQTALTGADVYFWFMAGFGDLERLKKSNFSPIDSPTIDAVISLIIQGFFAYRIWTLNKRALWLSLLIIVVRIIISTFQRVCLQFLTLFHVHEARHSTSCRGSVGWHQGEFRLV